MTVRFETSIIQFDEAGQRLDRWLRKKFQHLPQSRIEKLCRKGQIKIDNGRAKPSVRIAEGQSVTLPVTIAAKPLPSHMHTEQEIRIPDWLNGAPLFEDDHLIALNKPCGIASQGGTGQSLHVDRLAAVRFPSPQGPPKLVHRLDKETSGLLLLARTRRAAAKLAEDFRCRRISKFYLALVHGCPHPLNGKIETDENGNQISASKREQRAGKNSRSALTEYALIESIGQHAALLALKPMTGRMHQLRIHMTGIGHPIIGDRRYGAPSEAGGILAGPLMLHARALNFNHPHHGTPLRLEAPLPAHMRETFKQLGLNQTDFSCA